MVFTIFWIAVAVECFGLLPCWCAVFGMLRLILLSTIFSRGFAGGESKEIGRYEEVPSFLSLLGLCIGANLASFQVCGIIFLFMTLLKSLVIACIALDPKCFR